MLAMIKLKESTREFTAHLTLVGGAADPATRMVSVTAQVDPTDHPYWLRPGAFCEVTVPIGDARQGIVVPSLAVEPTEKGNTVFLLDDSGKSVHAVVVELGMHTQDGGIELKSGVKAGQKMVMRGIEPLSDAAPVRVSKTITLEEALKPPSQQDNSPGVGEPGGSAAPRGSGDGSGADGSGGGSGHGAGSGNHHRGSGSGGSAQ
jgi:hypothetical protein